MQYYKEAESPIKALVKSRVTDLMLKYFAIVNKRYENLDNKYRKERESLLDLAKTLATLHKNINDLCKRMLTMTININAKSAAVINAILNNMFSEKAAIDDLFFSMKKAYANAEEDFKQYHFLLQLHMSQLPKPTDVSEAEGMLIHLREDVILINSMVSNAYEKGYQFLCVLERTLKKINTVVDR